MSLGAEKTKESLEFLKEDIKKARKQWEDGEPFKSLLQRNDVSLEDLLDKFDTREAEAGWQQEYFDKARKPHLTLVRRRLAYLKSARKEFMEEYNDEITDVDYMRLLEVPFTDSKYVVEWSIEDIGKE